MKTFNFFKRFCGAALVLVAMAAPMLTSCYDDSALNEKLEAVQNEVDQIKTDLTQLKSDLAALKAAVDANLSVSQLNQLPDGYELVFSDGTKAVIKNGTSSVVGAKEDEDGVLYWTLNGEWLLDADGNKIKASAEDGETPQVALTLDEEDGYYYWTVNGEWLLDAEGNKVRANGIDGKEPVIMMYQSESNDDKWVWNVNGEILKDQNGEVINAQGPAGLDGDAFFESVKLSEDGTKLIITLLPEKEGEDNVVYEIPMGVFNIMFEKKEETGVTTDKKQFAYTISGVSKGDEVIVRVLSTNASVYEVVPDTESNAKGYIEVELPSGKGYVDVYALNNTTGEFKARSLKLEGTDFYLETEVESLHFSPAGDEVEFPLTTGVEYEVVMTDNGDQWLLAESAPRVKAVSYETLTLSAEANTTAADRKTTVIIKKKDAETVYAEFTIEQKNYYPELISVDDEPVKWEESFELWQDGAAAATDTKSGGVFTFALSDDFTKGVYKVSNMFVATMYWLNGQQVTGKGGEYYADINDEGKLVVYKADAVQSYGFASDVVVDYDKSEKKFSFTEAKTNSFYLGVNPSAKTGYLKNYSAVVKVDEPAGGDVSGIEALYGEYTEAVAIGYGNPETLVISNSDNSDYDIKMQFGYTNGEGATSYDLAYGKVSSDGKTIDVTFQTSNLCGPLDAATLAINGTVISGTITGQYLGTVNYSATKKLAFNPISLYGEYTEAVAIGYGNPETLVISNSDNSDYDIKMQFGYTNGEGATSYDLAYGKVSSDGKTIDVTFQTSNLCGPLDAATLAINGTVISGTITGQYLGTVNYSATKKAN